MLSLLLFLLFSIAFRQCFLLSRNRAHPLLRLLFSLPLLLLSSLSLARFSSPSSHSFSLSSHLFLRAWLPLLHLLSPLLPPFFLFLLLPPWYFFFFFLRVFISVFTAWFSRLLIFRYFCCLSSSFIETLQAIFSWFLSLPPFSIYSQIFISATFILRSSFNVYKSRSCIPVQLIFSFLLVSFSVRLIFFQVSWIISVIFFQQSLCAAVLRPAPILPQSASFLSYFRRTGERRQRGRHSSLEAGLFL